MPEDPYFPFVFFALLEGFYGIIDPKVLVVFGNDLDRMPFAARKKSEIFQNIKEATFFAGSLYHCVQQGVSGFIFVSDPFPFPKVLKPACNSPYF